MKPNQAPDPSLKNRRMLQPEICAGRQKGLSQRQREGNRPILIRDIELDDALELKMGSRKEYVDSKREESHP